MSKIILSLAITLFSQLALAETCLYIAPNGKAFYTEAPPPDEKNPRIICPDDAIGSADDPSYLEDVKFHQANDVILGRCPDCGVKYNNLIAKAADKYQVEEKLIHALIKAESSYNPNAVSPVGAVGLMQLMPDTGRRFGVKPKERFDPEKNIDAGVHYLRFLLDRYDNDMRLAIAAYNAGEGRVDPCYCVPRIRETRNHVITVMRYYNNLA